MTPPRTRNMVKSFKNDPFWAQNGSFLPKIQRSRREFVIFSFGKCHKMFLLQKETESDPEFTIWTPLELEIWSNPSKMTHSQPKMALFAAQNDLILAKISHFSREFGIFYSKNILSCFCTIKINLTPQITSNFVQKVENHRRDLEFTSKAL